MGMFDWLDCDFPLPGKPLEYVKNFQTKNLNNILETITITKDGKLKTKEDPLGKTPDFERFNGTIEFYGSNVVGVDAGGVYTKNGEDYETTTYKADFVDGKMTNVVQIDYEKKPALASKEMKPMPKFQSELTKRKSLLNEKIFISWPTMDCDDGYFVEVVYETKNEVCVKDNNDKLTVIGKYSLGSILFKDKEESTQAREFTKEQIKKHQIEYQNKISEKKKNV